MVKTKAELESVVKHYVENLSKQGVQVQKVIVFGSYGRGTATEKSDIDLAFISTDFDRYNLFQRQKLLASCRPGLVRTDVIGYSPAMLEQKKMHSPLVQQILADGMTLFAA